MTDKRAIQRFRAIRAVSDPLNIQGVHRTPEIDINTAGITFDLNQGGFLAADLEVCNAGGVDVSSGNASFNFDDVLTFGDSESATNLRKYCQLTFTPVITTGPNYNVQIGWSHPTGPTFWTWRIAGISLPTTTLWDTPILLVPPWKLRINVAGGGLNDAIDISSLVWKAQPGVQMPTVY